MKRVRLRRGSRNFGTMRGGEEERVEIWKGVVIIIITIIIGRKGRDVGEDEEVE